MKDGKTLTEGTPWKLILAFALPIMSGNLLQQLYNTADTIIVGNFDSEAALSAVGSSASLTMFYLSIAQGFSIGAGVIIAQLFGAAKTEEMRKNALASVVLFAGMGVLASITGVICCRFILVHLLSIPDSLLDMAVVYFQIYAVGLFFQFLYNIVAALLRAVGDSKATLYFLLVSSVINIILDILFIAGFGLGVAGAAAATVISQLCSCMASFWYIAKKYPVFQFQISELRCDIKTGIYILKAGVPMALQQIIVSCGFLFIQRQVNFYGESMVASFTVASRIENYLFIPTIAFQNTMATYSGQNIGAGKLERISKGLKQTVIMSLISTGCLAVIVFASARILIGFFGIEGQSMLYCIQHVRAIAFGFLIFACFFPCLGVFQGVGKGFFATLVSATALGMRVLFTYTLCRIAFIDYTSIWWAQPMGWIVAAALNYIYYAKGTWKYLKNSSRR